MGCSGAAMVCPSSPSFIDFQLGGLDSGRGIDLRLTTRPAVTDPKFDSLFLGFDRDRLYQQASARSKNRTERGERNSLNLGSGPGETSLEFFPDGE